MFDSLIYFVALLVVVIGWNCEKVEVKNNYGGSYILVYIGKLG